MAKILTPGMEAHIKEEVTTLATLWRVTRTDGVEFFFTDHDQSIFYDGNTYEADSGYQRSAISNDSSLSVDNLDVQGILTSDAITEEDLRAGKFDYAQIRIFIVNWANLSDGEIKMRTGRIGEVELTQRGVFKTELRGLTQPLSQQVVEYYQAECRADLGDKRCKFPIAPEEIRRSTQYAVGQVVKVATNGTGDLSPAIVLQVDGEGNANDRSRYGAVGIVGTQAFISNAASQFGSESIEFSPAGLVNPSAAYVSYPDTSEYNLAGRDFTIQGWVRFKDLSSGAQVIASKFTSTGDQRSWYLRRAAGNLEFVASTTGQFMDLAELAGTVNFQIDTWYHVAVTRRGNRWRLFFNGKVIAQTTVSGDIYNSTSPLYLGKYVDTFGSDFPLYGFIDDFQIYRGAALYVADFEVPTAAFVTAPATAQQSAYENIVYECTSPGTTASSAPTFDTTVSNTTTDGTVEWTARAAFVRHAWVGESPDNTTIILDSVGYAGNNDADGWYNGGALIFESGENEGRIIEVRDWEQATRTVKLFLPASYVIAAGTAVRLYPGCDKRSDTCRVKFKFGVNEFANGNIKNFRGEPFVPGNDSLVAYPDAK